jgi:hypothetical protein
MDIKTCHVSEIPENATFLCYSLEADSIKEDIGKIANEFDAFFVIIGEGEYTDVWGIHGCIPYLDKVAYKIL